jgi:hypothetical protein
MMMMMILGFLLRLLCLSHDHEAGSSSATPAAPSAIDPAIASILQSLTQQQAHLAAEQTRLSERMLSMFQTIQDRQDSLQQQLLQDRAEQGIHGSYATAFWCLSSSGSVCSTSSASRSCCASDSVRTPCSYCWSFFSAPAGHSGFHVTGSQLCLPSAASATSICCYHYCCGSICDHFCSGSSCSAASVRVSTSSSFYSRSWIRD